MFTKKLWVKFEDTEIECFCERKKCPPESNPVCSEFVVKFIEIQRSKEVEEEIDGIKDATKQLEARIKRETKKFETQLQRAMKKFRIYGKEIYYGYNWGIRKGAIGKKRVWRVPRGKVV